MKKDDTVILTIEDLSCEGLGIGKYQGMVFFVKDTVIGDVIEARVMKMKKSYGYARLTRLVRPSPDRVKPPCPVARQCGGCQIQAMSYDAQLRFKQEKVRDNLQRIGKFTDPPLEPIIGMEEPFRCRNKAQFPVGTDKNGNLVAGFYAGRTHSIIPCQDCLLGARVNARISEIVLEYMKQYGISAYDEKSGCGLVRHIMTRVGFATGEIMVSLVINGRTLPHVGALTKSLAGLPGMNSISLSINQERTNVVMGRELRFIWGREYIEDSIGGIRFRISPLSFYQVNPRQTEKLYAKALEYAGLTGTETVWDLYCGIGTISLLLSGKAKQVYGVEVVPEAVRDARLNASLNGITNAEFYVAELKRYCLKNMPGKESGQMSW